MSVLNRDNEVFCEIRWVREDVKTKLEELGIPVTDENIDQVIDACKETLRDLSIARGWEIIEELIPDELFEQQEQEAEQDMYLEAIIENAPEVYELPSYIDYDNFIEGAAYYLQRNIEKFDMDWDDALEAAISRSLKDREKVDFELYGSGIDNLSAGVEAAMDVAGGSRGDVARKDLGRG